MVHAWTDSVRYVSQGMQPYSASWATWDSQPSSRVASLPNTIRSEENKTPNTTSHQMLVSDATNSGHQHAAFVAWLKTDSCTPANRLARPQTDGFRPFTARPYCVRSISSDQGRGQVFRIQLNAQEASKCTCMLLTDSFIVCPYSEDRLPPCFKFHFVKSCFSN
jgi:hypothetical protein